MGNWIVGGVVLFFIALAIYRIYKDRKDGKGCGGCCDSCSACTEIDSPFPIKQNKK